MYNNVKHVRMSNAKIKGPLLLLLLFIDFFLVSSNLSNSVINPFMPTILYMGQLLDCNFEKYPKIAQIFSIH